MQMAFQMLPDGIYPSLSMTEFYGFFFFSITEVDHIYSSLDECVCACVCVCTLLKCVLVLCVWYSVCVRERECVCVSACV